MSKDEGSENIEADEQLEGQGSGDTVRTGMGPLSILMPPDTLVLGEARRLVADRSTRIEDLAVCASQDPVIVIELLRVANAMFFSGGRAAITSAKTAVIRLGGDVVLETFDKLKERPQFSDEGLEKWFEIHRVRCRRASIISTILAEALAKHVTEDCQVAGLLSYVGEMLAVCYLKQKYVKLAEEVSRGSMYYRLAQDLRFDVERMTVQYLKRHGIPEGILFVHDREARPRQADRAIMKPLCQAASEFVDAFDAGRLDKLSPGKIIPPKSALRLLQMNDTQYLRVYERVAEFLYSFKLIEEKRKQGELAGAAARELPMDSAALAKPQTAPEAEPKSNDLEQEIQNILKSTKDTEVQRAPVKSKVEAVAETVIEEIPAPLGPELTNFSLGKGDKTSKKVARVAPEQSAPKVAPPPKIHTRNGSKFLSSVTTMLSDVKSSEELLAQILGKLVRPGPFEKAAIIVVSKDRTSALVVAARGPKIGNGQRIAIDDPLNPLAQCFSKVQSFGNRANKVSPFGSKAFAVAPIDADHDTPVALYADCGANGALTFEARRIFRNVVEILNQKLPELPGGIPNELKV